MTQTTDKQVADALKAAAEVLEKKAGTLSVPQRNAFVNNVVRAVAPPTLPLNRTTKNGKTK